MAYFDSMFPSTVEIKYQVNTEDDAGGTSLTWAQRIASYKCRIYAGTGMIEITPTGQNILTTHKCIGEYNSGIVEGDALIDGNDSYRIIQVDKVYDGERVHHLEMRLKKENFDHA